MIWVPVYLWQTFHPILYFYSLFASMLKSDLINKDLKRFPLDFTWPTVCPIKHNPITAQTPTLPDPLKKKPKKTPKNWFSAAWRSRCYILTCDETKPTNQSTRNQKKSLPFFKILRGEIKRWQRQHNFFFF